MRGLHRVSRITTGLADRSRRVIESYQTQRSAGGQVPLEHENFRYRQFLLPTYQDYVARVSWADHAVSLRTAAVILQMFAAISCLLLSACSDPEAPRKASSVPGREQLAAAVAGYADVTSNFDQVRAIVVATGDRIVFEQYYGTDRDAFWGVHSVTKSVVSTLIGIAVGEGLIGSLDDSLARLLPGYAAVMSPAVAGTTLRQLLTMTAGFPSGDAFLLSQDWVRELVTNPESPPGGAFLYSNGTSHLLAAVLEQATRTSALDYARSRLFGPLGIDTQPAFRRVVTPEWKAKDLTAYEDAGFAWPVDPQGISIGDGGIKLRPRDLVKFGQLFLDGGRWGTQQVVPADWVDQATTAQVAADGFGDGYGYQWWTGTVDGDEVFRAIGGGGQVIEVVPDRNLVVVTAAEARWGDATSQGIFPNVLVSIIEDAIVAQFSPE